MSEQQNIPEIFGVKKLAQILGIGMNKAYELANRQDFPKIAIGRQIRITSDGLCQWLKNQEKMN